MKKKITHALFLITITALLALDSPPSQGPHGGAIKKAEGYYVEMKNNPDTSFFAYLLTKKLKTVSNKDVTAEVKLFFPDSTATDVPLKAIAGNAFTGKIIPGFYACKITFHIYEKEVSAQFAKEDQVVQK